MVTFLMSACTTMRPVPVRAAGVFVNIRPGDRLRVMTRSCGDNRITVATLQPTYFERGTARSIGLITF